MNRDGHCCIVSLRSYLPRRLQRLSATIASLYYLRRTQFGAAALHCSSGTAKKKRETREKESKASNAIFPLSDWHCTNNIVDGTLDLQDEDDGEKKLLEDLQEEIRRRGRQVKFRIDPAQTDTRLLLRLTGRVCN